MNLRNLNLLLFICIILSSSTMMAQSKLKKSKEDSKQRVVDAKSADQEETETIYTYIIMDLKGKDGTFSADMLIPKSERQKIRSQQTIAAEKKAAYTAREQSYPTEIDFLKTMQMQGMELVSVTNDQDKEGPFKRYYFKKEVIITK